MQITLNDVVSSWYTLREVLQQFGNPVFVAILVAFVLFAFVSLVFVLVGTRKVAPKRSFRKTSIFFKPILTKREEAMYERLVKAFPNHSILAQISFGALLDSHSLGERNRFDRKIADFAICEKYTARVLVLIELDDASHKGKEVQDAARDKMLKRAGYVVRRYPNVPRIATLQSDMKKLL